MPIPAGIGAVDLMIGFPSADARSHYENLRAMTKDSASAEMEFPAEYMFKQVPNHLPEGADPIEVALGEMDRCGVAIGMIGSPYGELAQRAVKEHPDRFVTSLSIDPNDITGAVRQIRQAKDEYDIKCVTSFPAGCNPQVPVSDRRYYPIFQTCVDLDIPIVLNAGIPGPRLPAACQDVMHFDEVCYDFPELTIVMRHGAEPWQELAVKLMLKWPGLYYMPSAFAPKHYPKEIIDYANSRGADKIMYAGYYPMGLSLRRIFEELPNVPFKDEVWPKFLRDNAMRVFKLGDSASKTQA
jgi:predicted TIM-barrel fold metal-dependent hydrolase